MKATDVLAVADPLRRVVDKLLKGHRDLVRNQEKGRLDYETLEQIVRTVERRTMPWSTDVGRSKLE